MLIPHIFDHVFTKTDSNGEKDNFLDIGGCAYTPYLDDGKYWFVALCASSLASSLCGFVLDSLFGKWPGHGVAWLWDRSDH